MIDDIEYITEDNEMFDDTAEVDEYSQNILKIHIGKNVHCRAKKASCTVDLRHSFFRNMSLTSEHPTQRGVKLTKYEFAKLLDLLPQLEDRWSGLAELTACYNTHDTQDDVHACDHCTPKPSIPRHAHRPYNISLRQPTASSSSTVTNSPN
jgi:hypothetical protein